MDALTVEEMEMVRARDGRFRTFERGLKIADELRRGSALRAILDAWDREAENALFRLADIPATDTARIVEIQATIKAYTLTTQALKWIVEEGEAAGNAITEEDQARDHG